MSSFITTDYYNYLCFSAYIILFLVNLFALVKYFKNRDKATKPYNKILKFDIVYMAIGLTFIVIERFFTFYCLKTNTDESFHLAIALKYIHGDNFWIDIDPSSVGPLNTLLFSFISIFTGEMSYFTAKITTLSVICISFILLYLSFIKIVPRTIACLISTCFAIHMCIPSGSTSISYNSEMILLPLLSLWLYSHLMWQKGSKYWMYLEFLVIGLMPFGKLQFGPVALLLFIVGISLLIKKELINKNDFSLKNLIKITFLPSICSALPLIVISLDAYMHNGLIWFYRFYFLNMISYINVDHLSWNDSPSQIVFDHLVFFWTDRFFLYFLSAFDFILIVACLLTRKYFIAIFCLLFIGISAYEVVKPLFYFLHYTNIMIIPLFVCGALLLGKLNSAKCYLLAITAYIFVAGYYIADFKEDIEYRELWLNRSEYKSPWNNIAMDIKKMADENDRLVVWGWLDELYVNSELPGGTAEIAIGGFVPSMDINRIYPKYTKEKFIDDIINNKPRFIIDTPSPVTPTYNSYDYSINHFSDISELIKENYHVVKEYVLSGNCEKETTEQNQCIKIPLYELNKINLIDKV